MDGRSFSGQATPTATSIKICPPQFSALNWINLERNSIRRPPHGYTCIDRQFGYKHRPDSFFTNHRGHTISILRKQRPIGTSPQHANLRKSPFRVVAILIWLIKLSEWVWWLYYIKQYVALCKCEKYHETSTDTYFSLADSMLLPDVGATLVTTKKKNERGIQGERATKQLHNLLICDRRTTGVRCLGSGDPVGVYESCYVKNCKFRCSKAGSFFAIWKYQFSRAPPWGSQRHRMSKKSDHVHLRNRAS